MRQAFIDRIIFTHSLPCLAEPGKVIVIGKPSNSLGEVIPYLANLPGVIAFNPETLMLTFRRQTGFLTLSENKVYITQVKDTQEGIELLQTLTEAINATWEHRHELQPQNIHKRAPRHLDVYALLPQTNCKKCGEASCLAFAVMLILQKRKLKECLPIQEDAAYVDRNATLEAML